MRYRTSTGVKKSLRAKALCKLANCAQDDAKQEDLFSSESGEGSMDPLEFLSQSLPLSYSSDVSKLYTIPFTISEWEVLMSLGQSSPSSLERAKRLLKNVISPYFLESPRQRVSDLLEYKFKAENLKHPNEVLTFQLTRFLIDTCSLYPDMVKECFSLIEQHLTLTVKLLNEKSSSVFSLIGFLSAFTFENDATRLTIAVWKTVSALFQKGEFHLQTSSHYSNETAVRYHAAHREVSDSLILNLMAQFHVSLACRVLEAPKNKSELSEYLLNMQFRSYQVQQNEITSSDDKAIIENFFCTLNENIALLLSMCDFAFKYCEDVTTLDLSNDIRAKFSFETRGYFIEFLMLIPFYETIGTEKGAKFTSLVCDSIDKFLLSELVSPNLIQAVICSASLLNYFTEKASLTLLRMFPLLVSSPHITTSEVAKFTQLFTLGLKPLNEDAVVTTVYSLNNLLTVTDNDTELKAIRERKMTLTSASDHDRMTDLTRGRARTTDTLEVIDKTNAALSGSVAHDVNDFSSTAYHSMLFKNCVIAAITIASYYDDQSITALAISILTQKVSVVSKELDSIIVESLANLVVETTVTELALMIKFYKVSYAQAMKKGNQALLKSIQKARTMISKELYLKCFRTDLYYLVLNDFLESITSCGELEKSDHSKQHTELSHFAEEIVTYLDPLAALLPPPGNMPLNLGNDEAITKGFRNIWFNMVIHGFHYDSDLVKEHYVSLLTIAFNTPPLASDFPASNREVSLDMNAVLRRSSSNSNHKRQKQAISKYLSSNHVQARTLSTPKIMFLASTALLETMRCEAGDCSKILRYYCDPSTVSSGIEKYIDAISNSLIRKYTFLVQSNNPTLFGSQAIAEQLNDLILCLSHRNALLQNAAFQCCDIFIRSLPSALCHHKSLFTLLDLMTTLFDSVLDCETNKFEPHYEFVLKHSGIKILLPDAAIWRKSTLERLQGSAREWVKIILNKANDDTKILLQSYIADLTQFSRIDNVEYGVSFAMDMAGSILGPDRELSKLTCVGKEKPNTISRFISQHSWRSKNLVDTAVISSPRDIATQIQSHIENIRKALEAGSTISFTDMTVFFDLSTASLLLDKCPAASLVFDLVHIPFAIFTSSALKIASNVWLTIIKERRDLAHILLAEIGYCWMQSIDNRVGLFSRKHDLKREENQKMEYAPYDKKAINRDALIVSQSFQPHRHVIRFFTSHFEGTSYQSESLLKLFTQWVLHGLNHLNQASFHPYARMARHDLLNFALSVLDVHRKQNSKFIRVLCRAIVSGGLTWFKKSMSWPFGSNQLKIKADLTNTAHLYSSLGKFSDLMSSHCGNRFRLLQYFLLSEINCIETWLSPLSKIENDLGREPNTDLLQSAFDVDPKLAVTFFERYRFRKFEDALATLIVTNPSHFVGVPEALDFYLLSGETSRRKSSMHHIVYWCPVDPLKSINLFLPPWNTNTFLLQYCVFSLEWHDVNVTFFYVPQITQCLRYDSTGYVERLILDTAKTNELFAHQIIWNMLANSYKDDEGIVEDELKPKLDHVRNKLVATFSGSKYDFYEKEFGFFDEVTSISGKLKPYIKKSKAEKKQKIDEEMKKIKIRPNVYLPSNPDGVVIDINRKSGKPLQSHAKAPFMATFKIKKTVTDSESGEKVEIEKWQAAIFKVGDDCRQDVLALQLISIFRTVWANIGLNIYVFPYRVTATAPGCGVIDVLPNSISRDMLGREAVNGLYEYFVTKFGDESTIEFQNARNNFVKSLAGYSVISYLLQFKDRHNGNIMYDEQGHCLHIDFGFIFDIVPGGVKFEAVPFKLTKEMVRIMGGSQDTQAYHDFEELCIQAYLSARPHMDAIIECVKAMLDSGLPCFKGLKTIKHLQNRFQQNRSDHEAALFMKGLIKKSYESLFTKGYDEFQRLTNGIPY